jgi:hypothetical protein
VGNDCEQLVNITTAPQVQLLSVPDCPLVERVRAALRLALARSGINAAVRERVGTYPSPSVLIDGRDVLTGQPAASHACCRLDLPTIRRDRRRSPRAGEQERGIPMTTTRPSAWALYCSR